MHSSLSFFDQVTATVLMATAPVIVVILAMDPLVQVGTQQCYNNIITPMPKT